VFSVSASSNCTAAQANYAKTAGPNLLSGINRCRSCCRFWNGTERSTREKLRERLWTSDTVVDFDYGLNAAVNQLRSALGDSAANPRFIQTLPRKGFRFIAPLEVVAIQQAQEKLTVDEKLDAEDRDQVATVSEG
jgi:hypothetical protein